MPAVYDAIKEQTAQEKGPRVSQTHFSSWLCFVLYSSVFAVSTYWKTQLFSNHTSAALSSFTGRAFVYYNGVQNETRGEPSALCQCLWYYRTVQTLGAVVLELGLWRWRERAVGLHVPVWGCGHGVGVGSSLPKKRSGRNFEGLSFLKATAWWSKPWQFWLWCRKTRRLAW